MTRIAFPDAQLPRVRDRWVAWMAHDAHDRLFVCAATAPDRSTAVAAVVPARYWIRGLQRCAGPIVWCATTPDGRQVVPLRPIVGSATPTTLLTETGQAPRRSLAADQLLRIERTVLVTSFDEPSEEIASARDVMSPESVCTERRYTFRVGPSLSTQTDVTIDALDRASGGRFVAVPPSSGVVALAADGALLWLSVPSERLFVNGAPFRTVPTARNTARCGSALALHSGGRGLSGTRFPRVPGTIQGARDLR